MEKRDTFFTHSQKNILIAVLAVTTIFSLLWSIQSSFSPYKYARIIQYGGKQYLVNSNVQPKSLLHPLSAKADWHDDFCASIIKDVDNAIANQSQDPGWVDEILYWASTEGCITYIPTAA